MWHLSGEGRQVSVARFIIVRKLTALLRFASKLITLACLIISIALTFTFFLFDNARFVKVANVSIVSLFDRILVKHESNAKLSAISFNHISTNQQPIIDGLALIISGNQYTSTNEIADIVYNMRGDSLGTIRNEIKKLPWVRDADISENIKDGKLIINLVEQKPFAISVSNGIAELYHIDGQSSQVAVNQITKFGDSILISGTDDMAEPSHAVQSLAEITAEVPELTAMIRAAKWVGNRRWDLYLSNDTVIKLPENNPKTAWNHMGEDYWLQQIMDQKLSTIDFRVENKIFLKHKNQAA